MALTIGDKDQEGNIHVLGGMRGFDAWVKPDGTYFIIMPDNGERVPAKTYREAVDIYNELNETRFDSFPSLATIYKVRERLTAQEPERASIPPKAEILAEYPGQTEPGPHYVYDYSGHTRCTCKGYRFRHACAHIDDYLKGGVEASKMY